MEYNDCMIHKHLMNNPQPLTDIHNAIRRALHEDVGNGDFTTENTIPINSVLKGIFLAKENGVIAGLDVVKQVFELFDKRLIFIQKVTDGDTIKKKTVVATVKGPGRSILTSERVALNFLQRMSGIATLTHTFVDAVKETGAVILDTRKTVPGLRIFDKWAVRLGGGRNHRFGLFDMALVKDNHIAACGSIRQAIQDIRKKTTLPIEVEVTTLKQLREAALLRPDRIMLDNMTIANMQKAVKFIGGAIPLEASGSVNLKTIVKIAKTGVNYISIGVLTHSVKALDIGLEIH